MSNDIINEQEDVPVIDINTEFSFCPALRKLVANLEDGIRAVLVDAPTPPPDYVAASSST